MSIFTISILMATVVYGIHTAISKLLEFFGFPLMERYINSNGLVQFLMHPTIFCNICMSSIWGAIVYFVLIQGTDWREWVMATLICVAILRIVNAVMAFLEN